MSGPEHTRLDGAEIAIMRSLIKRGASMRPVGLMHWQRPRVTALWRRDLVEIWYRQSPDMQPSLQGPYYGLTIKGAYLASSFFPAPRGISSGAEQQT